MPAYKTQFTSFTPSLNPGDALQLWNAEQPAPGNGTTAASERVAVAPRPDPCNLAVDGSFAGAPGAFEIDIEPASTDVELGYSLGIFKITAVDANNNFHLEIPNFGDRFVRACLVSRTNPVNVSLTVRRG